MKEPQHPQLLRVRYISGVFSQLECFYKVVMPLPSLFSLASYFSLSPQCLAFVLLFPSLKSSVPMQLYHKRLFKDHDGNIEIRRYQADLDMNTVFLTCLKATGKACPYNRVANKGSSGRGQKLLDRVPLSCFFFLLLWFMVYSGSETGARWKVLLSFFPP